MFCQTCNLSFKSKACYTKHLKTNRHIHRSSTDVTTFHCVCGRGYLYYQSLYVHRKKCEIHRIDKANRACNDKYPEILEKRFRQLEDQFEKKYKQLEDQLENKKTFVTIQENRTCKDEHQETLEQRCKELEDQLEKTKTLVTIQQQGRRKLSKDIRQEVANRQENKCNKCASNLSKYYQIDHITGLQFGGTDEFDNLQALCCECHAEKSILENQHRKEIQEAIRTILIKHGQ